MAYVNYEYYKAFSGSRAVPEEVFNSYVNQIDGYIDMITYNRVKDADDIPEEVSKAECELINTKYRLDVDGGLKTSESVGNVSVTYATGLNPSASKKMYNVAKIYLLGTGLLYKGVY